MGRYVEVSTICVDTSVTRIDLGWSSEKGAGNGQGRVLIIFRDLVLDSGLHDFRDVLFTRKIFEVSSNLSVYKYMGDFANY